MSYTKTQWTNDTAPAINATNLNKIENGIEANDTAITTATTNIGDLTTLTTTATTDLVSAINELDDLKATKDVATTSANGLMSSIDKGSLDSIFGVPTETVSNLDNVYEGAFKFNANTTNAPTTTSGKIFAFKIGNDNYRYQIVINDYSLPIYVRNRYYYQQWRWSGWYPLEADILSSATTYSTSEIRIGTWTNGKPLYRKVVPFTISSGWEAFGSFSDVDTFVKIQHARKSTGTMYPYYGGTGNYAYFHIPSNKQSIVIATAGETGVSGNLIVEYTKT